MFHIEHCLPNSHGNIKVQDEPSISTCSCSNYSRFKVKYKTFKSVVQNFKQQWININVVLTNFCSIQKAFNAKITLKTKIFKM